MPRRPLKLALGLALVLGASCVRHVPLDTSDLADIHKIAVIVRVIGPARATLPPGSSPAGRSPDQLGAQLEQAMSPFEVGERVRSALQQHLPTSPPFNQLAPSVQVESTLGSLLVRDRPTGPPRFDDLQQLGVDGVLYVEIDEWGAGTVNEKGAYLLRGKGRLFTLPGDSTVWQAPLTLSGPGSGLPANWLEVEQVREVLGELCIRAGEAVAVELGGTGEPVARGGALQDPVIEDRGHPPEKMKPVLPFVYRDVDAGAVDAGIAVQPVHAVPEPADGGDLLFPGTPPAGGKDWTPLPTN